MYRLVAGEGQEDDMQVLHEASSYMAGRTICALADGATSSILSLLKHFPDEVRARIAEKSA
jgi:NADH-quinone oxidoreductase subunit F